MIDSIDDDPSNRDVKRPLSDCETKAAWIERHIAELDLDAREQDPFVY